MHVDGDVVMNTEWPFTALEFMKRSPDFGAVCGKATTDFNELPINREDKPIEKAQYNDMRFKVSEVGRTKGTVLVRRSALESAGGLNPHITGDEEAELSYRLKASGFKIGLSEQVMAFHPERQDATVAEALRRLRYGYFKGQGKVLKAGYRQGRKAFLHHLLRLRVHVLYLVWNLAGVVVATMAVFGIALWPLFIWILGTIAGVLSLGVRHGFRDVPRRLLSSFFVTIGILQAPFQRLPEPTDFPMEWIRSK